MHYLFFISFIKYFVIYISPYIHLGPDIILLNVHKYKYYRYTYQLWYKVFVLRSGRTEIIIGFPMKVATGNILNQQSSTGGDNIYQAFIDLIVLVHK